MAMSDERAVCPACGEPARDGRITCGQAQCGSDASWRYFLAGQNARGATLSLSNDAKDPVMRDFLEACRNSGLQEGKCRECGRWFMNRRDDDRCPPCAGRAPPDCYRCGSRGHLARNCSLPKLEPGMSLVDNFQRAVELAGGSDETAYVQIAECRWLVGTAPQLARFGHFELSWPDLWPGRCEHCNRQRDHEADVEGVSKWCSNPECPGRR